MYCPKCGQEIASGDLRFCPRCGLALLGVAQFLTREGPIQSASEPPAAGLRIFRKREYRVPAKLIYFSVFTVPFAVALSIIFDAPGPLLLPFVLFIVGIAMLSYTFLFGRGWKSSEETTSALPHAQPHKVLGEHREYISPIEPYGGVTTNELREPPSVTEKTTNLLKDERD
jgi:hypothetical protein